MKRVILTIDDGPSAKFGKILNYLIKNNHQAILFIVGKNVNNENRDLLIKAIKKGIVIGNHSYTHPNFNFLSVKKAKEEIANTDKIINDLYKKAKAKRDIKIFRFPSFRQGILTRSKLQKYLQSQGYTNSYQKNSPFGRVKCQKRHFLYHLIQSFNRRKTDLYCNVDPADWDKKTTWKSVKRILDKAEDGDIIDLHDQGHNLDLTIKIIDYLTSKGFRLSI